MSKDLMINWIDDVFIHARDSHMGPDDGATEILDDYVGSLPADDEARSEIGSKHDIMLLFDSWTGQSNFDVIDMLNSERADVLQIPKRTSDILQPLDVNFNRQYKKFVKRILQRATFENKTSAITSREGVIKMHSFIWDQFSSVKYNDMIRYAWHNTDPGFVGEELTFGPPPRMVTDIQFSFDRRSSCDFICSNKAFVQCVHDDKHACLSHFMQGKCSRNHGVQVVVQKGGGVFPVGDRSNRIGARCQTGI